MWWFLKKTKGGQTPDTPSQPPDTRSMGRVASEDELLRQIPDMSALMQHDAAIKVSLPEPVARLVKWMADAEGASQSSWVRERLFEYVYGRAAAQAHRIRSRRGKSDGPLFARAPVDRTSGRYVYLVPQLGKNTVGFKLWLASQMKVDLQQLADHANVKLSPFVREAIISDLLGHGSLPERPQMFGGVTEEALAWERDEEVPVEMVEAANYEELGHADACWVKNEPGASHASGR